MTPIVKWLCNRNQTKENDTNMKKPLYAIALCVITLLLSAGVLADSDSITFKDPAIEAQLRRILEIYERPLTREDLLGVECFRYDPYEIWTDKVRFGSSTRDGFDPYGASIPQVHSLEDLALCPNLTMVALHHQPISDLSPLRSLTKLQTINFSDCPNIIDLSPLSSLENLIAVGLDGINTPDLSPVLRLQSLYTFGCNDSTHPIDLSALAQTSNLSFFFLRGEYAALDYTPLTNHPNLGEVSLVGVDDDTLARLLSSWPHLSSLELHNSTVTNDALSILSSHSLSSITLVNCENITDLSNLRTQTELYQLRVGGCGITDISSILEIPSPLQVVDLRGTLLADISPLGELTNIYELSISAGESYSREDVQRLLPNTQIVYGDGVDTQTALPDGIVIREEDRLPLTCVPLQGGGFLLSGFTGAPAGTSISNHLLNYLELPEVEWGTSRPLSSYIAAYDSHGAEQWCYQTQQIAYTKKSSLSQFETGRYFA